VLEARFHPATRARGGFVVVGRVVCDQSQTAIEHSDVAPNVVKPFDSERLHTKLEFLVTSVVGDRAQALLALRSRFWSFVETPNPGGHRSAA
jgi:hypothetical protein